MHLCYFFLSLKLRYVHCFFFGHDTVTNLTDYITFIAMRNQKFIWLILLWNLLYCGSQEFEPTIFSGFGCTSFTDHIFSVVCKKSVPHQRPSRFSPICYLEGSLIFYVQVHNLFYCFFFANSFERYLDSFCCMRMPRCSRNHLLEMTIFATLHCLWPSVKYG